MPPIFSIPRSPAGPIRRRLSALLMSLAGFACAATFVPGLFAADSSPSDKQAAKADHKSSDAKSAGDKAATDKAAAGKAAAAEIVASEHAFMEAFDKGDAKAIAALWTPSGSLIDDQGRSFKGRQAIEDEYTAFFKDNVKARIEVAIQSIERPTADTAIEDGVARVISHDGAAPVASRYTAFHVRLEGKWLMASVRETAIELPSAYPQLRELEWLIGNWEMRDQETTVHTAIRWIADRSFLQREYVVRHRGVTTSSGMQIIGWDPQAEKIRSWSFDSTGGHGTGFWTADRNGWSIESVGTLADGTPTAARDLLIRVPDENDVFGWRSTNRKVGEKELPDAPEVSLERVAPKH